jgi:hypothetical protein
MTGGSFTPDAGQRVDEQGHVTYDFTGHVSAEGLDLKAVTAGGGATPSPPNDRRVRWLREADGSLVAEVFGFDPVSFKRGLWVGAGAAPSTAANPTTRRLLIDETGASSFLQLANGAGGRRTCTHWGQLDPAGGAAIAAGAVFGPLDVIIPSGYGEPCITLGVRDFGNANSVTCSAVVSSNTNFSIWGKNLGIAPALFRVSYHVFGDL